MSEISTLNSFKLYTNTSKHIDHPMWLKRIIFYQTPKTSKYPRRWYNRNNLNLSGFSSVHHRVAAGCWRKEPQANPNRSCLTIVLSGLEGSLKWFIVYHIIPIK